MKQDSSSNEDQAHEGPLADLRSHEIPTAEQVVRAAHRIGRAQARLMRIAATDGAVIDRMIAVLEQDGHRRRLEPAIDGAASAVAERRVAHIWARLDRPRTRDQYRRARANLSAIAHRVRWNPIITHAAWQAMRSCASQRALALAEPIYRRWRRGVNDIVIGHWRFTAQCIDHIRDATVPHDDLLQTAVLGTARAAERFTPARDRAFTTYAKHWIRAAIGEARRNEFDYASLAEIGESIGTYPLVALDSTDDAGRDAIESDEPDPLDLSDYAGRWQFLETQRLALGERQRYVVERLYGLDGAPPAQNAAIAGELAISAAHVSKLRDQAIAELRHRS